MFAVEIAGVKITFVSLPTVVCALLYGPVDACIVGLLGAFLEQMLKYGFTATTVLWLLPAVLRGLIVGLGTVVLRRSMSIEAITSTQKPYVYYIVCIVAGLVTSCANTLVFYLGLRDLSRLFLCHDLRHVLGAHCHGRAGLARDCGGRAAGLLLRCAGSISAAVIPCKKVSAQ